MSERHIEHSFGRDGISGMLNRDRAVRARDVSQPDAAALKAARTTAAALKNGRRPTPRPPGS